MTTYLISIVAPGDRIGAILIESDEKPEVAVFEAGEEDSKDLDVNKFYDKKLMEQLGY